MRRCKAETIGDMIRQFLRREGLETPLNERRIVAAAGSDGRRYSPLYGWGLCP